MVENTVGFFVLLQDKGEHAYIYMQTYTENSNEVSMCIYIHSNMQVIVVRFNMQYIFRNICNAYLAEVEMWKVA